MKQRIVAVGIVVVAACGGGGWYCCVVAVVVAIAAAAATAVVAVNLQPPTLNPSLQGTPKTLRPDMPPA